MLFGDDADFLLEPSFLGTLGQLTGFATVVLRLAFMKKYYRGVCRVRSPAYETVDEYLTVRLGGGEGGGERGEGDEGEVGGKGEGGQGREEKGEKGGQEGGAGGERGGQGGEGKEEEEGRGRGEKGGRGDFDEDGWYNLTYHPRGRQARKKAALE